MGIFTFSCNAQEPVENSAAKQSIHQFKLTDLNGETFSMSSLNCLLYTSPSPRD